MEAIYTQRELETERAGKDRGSELSEEWVNPLIYLPNLCQNSIYCFLKVISNSNSLFASCPSEKLEPLMPFRQVKMPPVESGVRCADTGGRSFITEVERAEGAGDSELACAY